MQALQFSETGTLDSLQVRDVPRPVPGPGEVLIEVRATGINPSDLKNVLGSFPYTRRWCTISKRLYNNGLDSEISA